MSSNTQRNEHRGLLRYIAAFKFLKAALLIVVTLAAFGLVSPSARQIVERVLAQVASPFGPKFVETVLAKTLRLDQRKLHLLGIGALVYAVVFLVEGVGLWRARRWAEYFTVAVTASLIPFEIYELAHEVTIARISALVINVLILAYLIVRLWSARRRQS